MLQGQEAAKEALARAADLRDELATLRDSHQRQLETLRGDLAKELAARAAARQFTTALLY